MVKVISVFKELKFCIYHLIVITSFYNQTCVVPDFTGLLKAVFILDQLTVHNHVTTRRHTFLLFKLPPSFGFKDES